MKKLIFLFAFVVMALGLTAQEAVIRTSKVYVAKGAAKDTLNKDGEVIHTMLVADYATGFKFQVEQTKLDGDWAKTKTYLESSLDFATWTKVDSVSIIGNGKGVSAWKTPYTQYLRLRSVGVDSVQTTKIKFTYLIEKKP
jgi:hypothetical protein